ncbi:hypothetical protein GIB67_040836 [Kingdonia uniflora]|uniref:Protein POLLENLESS 3-LIKE 2-like n=1 Tax=Kingdonia uniflora TaxID=39325 RepID=A0A7J7P4V6_9MAGN|nr:hypothetical protein GIB67_040836 [Kingdonia uniflora]
MMQDQWNGPPGFRPTKSAPCSPAKPLGISRTRSDSFHITHKVPVGDTPYVKAKNVQLVDKDPEKAIPLFWAAINAGDRVDSALKDMAIVMKQQNRAEEAIEAIKSLRSRCSDQAQESLDNILLDLYKRCGRLDDQVSLLKHKLFLIQQGMAFNGKRTKTARSQGKKFQVSVEQEATRLLGNLGWAFMQQNNYNEAEDAYRRALSLALDNNKMCNLGICLMKQGRIVEAKETLRKVKPAMADGPRGVDSHLKAFERAQEMLRDLESEMMNKEVDRVEQSRLFDAFLGSSSIWQPQPCKETVAVVPILAKTTKQAKPQDGFADENVFNLNSQGNFPLQKSIKAGGAGPFNVDAPPFYSSKVTRFQDPLGGVKRSRSVNNGGLNQIGDEFRKDIVDSWQRPEQNKNRRRSLSPNEEENEWTHLLPDSKAFEDALVAAALGKETVKNTSSAICERKIDKRLRVFADITPSLSPRA